MQLLLQSMLVWGGDGWGWGGEVQLHSVLVCGGAGLMGCREVQLHALLVRGGGVQRHTCTGEKGGGCVLRGRERGGCE